jgi:ferrous iron transport protein A
LRIVLKHYITLLNSNSFLIAGQMADADLHTSMTGLTLDGLQRGIPTKVEAVLGDLASDAITQRLYEMGFEPGALVEITHVGPLGGDPLVVKVGAMSVALRRAEAARVRVRRG